MQAVRLSSIHPCGASLLHELTEAPDQSGKNGGRDLHVVGQQVEEFIAADAQQPSVFNGARSHRQRIGIKERPGSQDIVLLSYRRTDLD